MSEGVEHLLAVQKSSRNCKQKKRHHVINKTTVLTNRIKHECASACVCVLVGTPCGVLSLHKANGLYYRR